MTCLCKDCKHSADAYYPIIELRCRHKFLDPVDGQIIESSPCHLMRSREWACGASGKVWEPKAAKPRRMKANYKVSSGYHSVEHDETPGCNWSTPCQPVAAEPLRANMPPVDLTEPQRPDPGEGWRLLEDGEFLIDGDEMHIGSWSRLSVHAGDRCGALCSIRRRVEPAAQAGTNDCVHNRGGYCDECGPQCTYTQEGTRLCGKYRAAQEPQDCIICGADANEYPRISHSGRPVYGCSDTRCPFNSVRLLIEDWNRLALKEEGKC